MTPVLSHQRLDLGQFPDLMPQWFGVVAGKMCPATTTFVRLKNLHVVAISARQEWPFALGVAWLTATLFL
jgi:hypothetical protein